MTHSQAMVAPAGALPTEAVSDSEEEADYGSAYALRIKVTLVFFVAIVVGACMVYLLDRNHVLRTRQAVVEIAGIHAHLLQERLNRGFSATYALAAVVRQGQGQVVNFNALANEMLSLYGEIGALALAPGGIVSQIIPLAGNEGAVGHNLLRDPLRNKEALAAIESRKLTVAGPFPLRQGGVGVVGRLAVFLPGHTGQERFWGFTTAVLHIEDLVEASQLKALARTGYHFELSRRHPDSGERGVFARSSPMPLVQPVFYAFQVPNGEWTLGIEPDQGWHASGETIAAQSAAVIVAALLLAALAFRLFQQPLILRRQVALRTRGLSEANRRLATGIAERQATECALRESEARFRTMADTAPVLIWIADPKMRVGYLNQAWVSFTGHDASQNLRHGWLDSLHPDDRSASRTTYRLIRTARREFQTELRLRRHDGEYRWVTVHGVPRMSPRGDFAGYIGSCHDITDLKRAEQVLRTSRDALEQQVAARTTELRAANTALSAEIEERTLAQVALIHEKEHQQALIRKLEDAQNQLLQSEKMASIGQLAAGVAHEINNPIGFVSSNLTTLGHYAADLLAIIAIYEQYADPLLSKHPATYARIAIKKDEADLADLRRDLPVLLEETLEGVLRVRNIVRDLKEFSHVAETEWQRTDLHKGMDSTINVVWNELKHKAEVIKEYGQIPPVECLASQVNQVFMNLLVNAAQAIDTKGVITVRSGQADGMVWLEVADTGAGIAPEIRQRIFEPFFTTKPVGQGTGLGLSVSYGIINKHGGRIDVASEVGSGSTFRVWLPLRRGS